MNARQPRQAIQPSQLPVKYYGEQDSRHAGNLFYPGSQGLPFRGEVAPTVAKHELAALPVVSDFHHKTFDLSNEEDAAYYNWVKDHEKNGLFAVFRDIPQWDADTKTMYIYLEWAQLYVEASPTTSTGGQYGKAYTIK